MLRDNVAAGALALDEVGLLERAQLVADGALRGARLARDVRDAEVASHEAEQDLNARGVREDLEQVGQVIEKLLVGQLLRRLSDRDSLAHASSFLNI